MKKEKEPQPETPDLPFRITWQINQGEELPEPEVTEPEEKEDVTFNA